MRAPAPLQGNLGFCGLKSPTSASYANYYQNNNKKIIAAAANLKDSSKGGNQNSAVWNDLQIDQWAEDDNMRKTRAQNDQFWGHLDYNVDEHMN